MKPSDPRIEPAVTAWFAHNPQVHPNERMSTNPVDFVHGAPRRHSRGGGRVKPPPRREDFTEIDAAYRAFDRADPGRVATPARRAV